MGSGSDSSYQDICGSTMMAKLDQFDLDAEREGSAIEKMFPMRPLVLGKRIKQICNMHTKGHLKQSNRVVGRILKYGSQSE